MTRRAVKLGAILCHLWPMNSFRWQFCKLPGSEKASVSRWQPSSRMVDMRRMIPLEGLDQMEEMFDLAGLFRRPIRSVAVGGGREKFNAVVGYMVEVYQANDDVMIDVPRWRETRMLSIVNRTLEQEIEEKFSPKGRRRGRTGG